MVRHGPVQHVGDSRVDAAAGHVLVLRHADPRVPKVVGADPRRQPPSSISVATVLRNEWLVASATPSSWRTSRQRARKLSGSRHVPAVEGNTMGCWPR